MIRTSLLPESLFNPNKLLGGISHVSISQLKVQLSETPNSDEQSKKPRANIGQYVVVDCGEYALTGQISDLSLSSAINQSVKSIIVATVEIVSSFNLQSGEISAGAVASPRIGDCVFAADKELVRKIVEERHHFGDTEGAISLALGRLPHAGNTPVTVSPERIFGRHCAVVGSTGAGKSWTLARIIEEAARYRCKIILFDAVGEFGPLSDATRHLFVGNDPDPAANSTPVSVPYYHLTENDLFAIFSPSGESQAPKLRAAMKSLKLAKVAPGLALDGHIVKAHKSKVEFEKEYRRHIEEIETPFADFDIRHLPMQIQNECIAPQRSPQEPLVWGGPNGQDLSLCVSLINRIEDIIASRNLSPIFNPDNRPSLFKEFHSFIKEEDAAVLHISLKYLSFDHNAREIVANALGRHLLEMARRSYFRERPLVVVVDEAHQFLNTRTFDADSNTPLNSFGLIAKEGRKYCMNICLATQRPRDIPEGVMSQMGTMIVHRLINGYDREVVERASGQLDRTSANLIPSLAPGEAILLGVDFPVPLFMKVTAPQNKPDSKGPDFQKFWF